MKAQPVPSQAKPLPRSVPVALKCGWEAPSAAAKEVELLSRRWAIELGQPPFEPDWERIFALERANSAKLWTARTIESGVLVGFMFCTFNRGIFTSKNFARIEVGYLAPEWRGLGFRFVKSIMREFKTPVEWETNDLFKPDEHGRSRVARVLERLGFEQIGTCMRRR